MSLVAPAKNEREEKSKRCLFDPECNVSHRQSVFVLHVRAIRKSQAMPVEIKMNCPEKAKGSRITLCLCDLRYVG